MNEPPVFLSADNVIAIHRRMTEEFGGDASVRDRGLLESAVMLPAAQFGGKYLHDGIPVMAAAYLSHICQNHAFVDGNKRTALVSAEVFVELNDMRLAAANKLLEELTLAVAAGEAPKEVVTEFFRKHTAAKA